MDESVEVSKHGGFHSKIPYRFDLLPPEALIRAATILKKGIAKYPVNNWRLIEPEAHLNHALAHLVQYMAGDTTEDHLGNALCRVMFLIATSENPPVTLPEKDPEEEFDVDVRPYEKCECGNPANTVWMRKTHPYRRPLCWNCTNTICREIEEREVQSEYLYRET